MKWISLGVMFFQNGMTPIFFRYATTGAASAERFSTSVAVICQEILKLLMFDRIQGTSRKTKIEK